MRRGLLPGIAVAAAALGGALLVAERPWRRPAHVSPPRPLAPAPPSEPELGPGAPWPWARDSAPPVTPVLPEVGEISVLTLLGEMAALDHLARLPATPYRATQTSSYDRRSRSPADPATWFANDDFITNDKPNLVRVETAPDGSKRYVLLDATGPGAVVRLWTATPTGTLRIFIDDEATPALEAPMARLLAGALPPFEPPFGQTTAMGSTLYFPFPYRKRCLITLDSIISTDPFSGRPVDRVYYQIGARRYGTEAAAQVRPFSWAELDRARAAITAAATALKGATAPPPAAPAGPARVTTLPEDMVTANHATTATVQAPAGGGCITEIRLATPERDPARLQATMLTMTFDGEQTVRLPLVDFFGTGNGWNSYASLPLAVGADGTLVCRFPMPFRRTAVLSLSAPGLAGPGVTVGGALTVEPRRFDARSLLFHARRRPHETMATRPFKDWHIATLGGAGHLVGTVLDVENPPQAMWWGEGDEKIYVDGETFPGIFGTGTEDYFGYAWSSTETFAHPYHAQTRATGPGFTGQFSMNRFHVLDPIPFTTSLRFDLEAWHWTDTTLSMAATLYWYARPAGNDDFPRQ